jgi:hypothetical protein
LQPVAKEKTSAIKRSQNISHSELEASNILLNLASDTPNSQSKPEQGGKGKE